MEFLRITCHKCGNKFDVYHQTLDRATSPQHCPHCLARMTQKQWERLTDAFFTFADVNKNFRKGNEDRGEALFEAEVLTAEHYVKPEEQVIY